MIKLYWARGENYNGADRGDELDVASVKLIHFSFQTKCREIWEQSKSSFKEKKMDIHTRLMRKYNQVPEWWFWCILVANIALAIFVCEYYNEQLQLPWWGVLLACLIAIFFTLPIGIITAITNQVIPYDTR